ncbi:hypothetical protein LUZ60_013537 [Juncus effusus]|nr:hypothetical protein LUZ60_013537 [Juncus effusus]
MDPDWSNLPADVVQLISEKIIFKVQYTYLRLVCQQWRLACPPHPSHLISLVPWLWLPHDSSSSVCSFYDFSQSKTYDFDLPDIAGTKMGACSRGWIMLEKNMELSLINPITKELKSNCLPSLAAPAIILERNEKAEDFLHHGIHPTLIRQFIFKIILTSSPSDEDCIVIAQFQILEWELGFCRVGDDCWTILKLREKNVRDHRLVSDFKYKNGLVYSMNYICQITVYDIQDLSQKILKFPQMILDVDFVPSFDEIYLALGEGELDGAFFAVKRIFVDDETDKFEVYKCNKTKGPDKWRRVKTIGNVLLILGGKQCEILSLDNIELNGWEKNHICHYKLKYCRKRSPHNSIIQMTSIENGSVKEIPTSLGAFSTRGFSWFTPKLC